MEVIGDETVAGRTSNPRFLEVLKLGLTPISDESFDPNMSLDFLYRYADLARRYSFARVA